MPIDAADVTAMSWQQLQLLAARLVTLNASADTVAITDGGLEAGTAARFAKSTVAHENSAIGA